MTTTQLNKGDKVRITMISKEGVARQKFIPKFDEEYKIGAILDNSIVLSSEKYGQFVYLKGQLRLNKTEQKTSGCIHNNFTKGKQ